VQFTSLFLASWGKREENVGKLGGMAMIMAPFQILLVLIILALDLIALFSVAGGAIAPGRKMLWIALILFFPFIGVILYFLIDESPEVLD
jgi:hypothetical protein